MRFLVDEAQASLDDQGRGIQRNNGDAVEVCRHRAVVYERARQLNTRRWSRSTRCWRQPKVVWINQPPDELDEPG